MASKEWLHGVQSGQFFSLTFPFDVVRLLLFLPESDEPSTGLDPASRRHMWRLLSSRLGPRHCLILTTHSMEECESLCQRVGIMVDGRFACLGSTTHLRQEYGSGYQIDVSLTAPQQEKEITEALNKRWRDVNLIERCGSALKFRIPRDAEDLTSSAFSSSRIAGVVSVSKLFRFMEDFKATKGLHEYSVSQTTLEQIFLFLAKKSKRS